MTDFTPIQIFGIVMASLIAAAILAILVRSTYKLAVLSSFLYELHIGKRAELEPIV